MCGQTADFVPTATELHVRMTAQAGILTGMYLNWLRCFQWWICMALTGFCGHVWTCYLINPGWSGVIVSRCTLRVWLSVNQQTYAAHFWRLVHSNTLLTYLLISILRAMMGLIKPTRWCSIQWWATSVCVWRKCACISTRSVRAFHK